MSIAVVTGSAGLVGSETARRFAGSGHVVIGIDNDMRKEFFGGLASTAWNRRELQRDLGAKYVHCSIDIRDRDGVLNVFAKYGEEISVVVHAAAQPSHDWAASAPLVDFDINATGTLTLLEATRRSCPKATFIFTSTNKVYGDTPNLLPLKETETRWELDSAHEYFDGITEEMKIDQSLHSLFGASKIAADILVQEYGRYFGLHTACFRGGTLTGPVHSATELHGFLGYLMRCTMSGTKYHVYGYKGKQVRDAIHSSDLVSAFEAFHARPQVGAVYNIGGGRFSHCSILEAIEICQEVAGANLQWDYVDRPRVGDHIWWVGSNARFCADYPEWGQEYDVSRILEEMYEHNRSRWIS